MSSVQLEMIWQHDNVLPYILNELKQYVERITPVHQIYLYGSRAKTPIADWTQLAGKDWDIMMVCSFPIINTYIWTTDRNYHIDLSVIGKSQATELQKYRKDLVELFPNYELNINMNDLKTN
ncbi:hypothetical protein H2O64_18495 [Kordia sp. YSTF-M3]|uniref:Nucleotidyltransferase domain-containing protein n=1 Tax=Kordia aestuariivivens TaxID=2759037 RepID=A0ABR7QDP2_9FLAO|nr:hypothetical protein [Kordia aestuariivivens]MBC8756669.1 hypothetical protein [Kordia aestuariivivens]